MILDYTYNYKMKLQGEVVIVRIFGSLLLAC